MRKHPRMGTDTVESMWLKQVCIYQNANIMTRSCSYCSTMSSKLHQGALLGILVLTVLPGLEVGSLGQKPRQQGHFLFRFQVMQCSLTVS